MTSRNKRSEKGTGSSGQNKGASFCDHVSLVLERFKKVGVAMSQLVESSEECLNELGKVQLLKEFATARERTVTSI